MVLWVNWGSAGHLSCGVSHMVAARYQLGAAVIQRVNPRWPAHMAGGWCWLSSGSSGGVFNRNIYVCPPHVTWPSYSLVNQFPKEVA